MELKKHKTCTGCRAAYTPQGIGAEWNCALGYKTELVEHKDYYMILAPGEPCPKPRTAKFRDELLGEVNGR